MNTKITGGLFAIIALLFMVGLANAAVVRIDPSSITVDNGSIFDLTVKGDEFTSATTGGGFKLIWDIADMTLLTSDIDVEAGLMAEGFDFNAVNPDGSTPGQLDVIASIFFGSPVSGNFDIVTLSFQANQPGITSIDIGIFENQNVWVDENLSELEEQPDYVGATITVQSVVPVPPAIWLFGSGLLGMIGVARHGRQKVT